MAPTRWVTALALSLAAKQWRRSQRRPGDQLEGHQADADAARFGAADIGMLGKGSEVVLQESAGELSADATTDCVMGDFTETSWSAGLAATLSGSSVGLQTLGGRVAVNHGGWIGCGVGLVTHDHELLKRALKSLGPERAMREVDGGGLPAVFYAVELGYMELAHTLLVEGHCLTVELADRVLNVIKDKGPTRAACLRVFQMACEIVSNGCGAGTSQLKSEGVALFIKPWCASLPALNFFQPRKELFARFRSLCKASCKRIFDDIDSKAIGTADMRVLMEVAKGLPAESCRQDDEGLLPPLDWSLGDGDRADIGIPEMTAIDHELIACRTLSLLAIALDGVFQADMEKLAPKSPFGAEGPPACQPRPPKPFSAVQSWLLALPRMDDLDAKMPRAMEEPPRAGRCDFVCDRPEVLKAVRGPSVPRHLRQEHPRAVSRGAPRLRTGRDTPCGLRAVADIRRRLRCWPPVRGRAGRNTFASGQG
ncbi:unnamed protein product [Prorocentrum cordatum]|uniref:Uncharacterized protein n=1 Tax=Prorocentrum cordatum TaxID=2364126 RepID=A0ABN9UK62_9DINO|nr:unnamed protein product [Polarella glacialis]